MPLVMNKFSSRDELNSEFAATIANLLSDAISAKGEASIAVSGGSTPLGLFQQLSKADVEWSKVTITLADERWVDNTHSDSNEKLVRDNLMVNAASEARFFSLKTAHDNAFDAESSLENADDQPSMPFDVLILGMGGDSHTASLFPCCAQITDGLDLSSSRRFIATEPTTAPHQRMSYTLSALVSAKALFLHLTGDNKLEVLEESLNASDPAEKPIKAVVDNADVTLMWAP